MLLRSVPLKTSMLGLGATLFFVALYSITVGPMNISLADSAASLLQPNNDLAPHINLVIQEIRLPRTILCMLIGAILALCGAVMQGLFRNPLAEPGIIGVSAGASLGAALAIVLSLNFHCNTPLF